MHVSILDDYLDTLRSLPSFAKLAGHDVIVWTEHTDDVDLLAERLAGCEALVLIRERTEIRAPLLERLEHLVLVSQRSAYPHLDVEACSRLGIVVSSNLHAGAPSYATAELTFALILAAMRRLPEQVASLRAGRWQSAVGRTLRGKRLGLYGYGRIARVVAGYARAFEMDVRVLASEASSARAAADGLEVASSRAAFFSSCDVISLHLRLVAATRGVVTAGDLARMAPDSLFVNTSRAGLVEPGALVAALRRGHPGGAALDVFEHEPLLDPTDSLLGLDNVVCTPHLGYVTLEEWDLQFAEVFDQINAFAAGAPSNVVNPDVLTHLRGATGG